MPYDIDQKLVIAVASSALFDLTESDQVYREHGTEVYRAYSREHENDALEQGVAFPLIRRLLALNGTDEADSPVEVVLISRNDPDTGLRVFKSIQYYGLDITRAAFVSGSDPFRYLGAFNAALFLSANPDDVRSAIMRNAPAGRVFPTRFIDNESEPELRIAFDFDGVIADDSAESVAKRQGLDEFLKTEREKSSEALPVGPLHRFFSEIAKLQKRERERKVANPDYQPMIRIAIITARNAPAHERVVTSLRQWGIQVDEAFFLEGIDKGRVLREFKPHIFFDDQVSTIEDTAQVTPSAHVPFGVANQAVEMVEAVYKSGEQKNAGS